eukprot:7372297-Prymnesium_polylepis.1
MDCQRSSASERVLRRTRSSGGGCAGCGCTGGGSASACSSRCMTGADAVAHSEVAAVPSGMRCANRKFRMRSDLLLDLLELQCLAHLHRISDAARPAGVEADVHQAVLDAALHALYLEKRRCCLWHRP